MPSNRVMFGVLAAALVLSSCAQNATSGNAFLPAPTGQSRSVASAQSQTGGSYRHGVVWMRNSPRALLAINAKDLHYQGGTGGVGVTTGIPKVYVVFWGSQWGTQGVNASGDATFSGDPAGLAPYVQAFFHGLGTGSERWSGVLTQYCQGVAVGATFCPTTAAHVGYPTGGALAGVWEDTSKAAPASATANQIAVEAERAAAHFGKTTNALNRHVQYDIISPTGTDPDQYQEFGFCAWHDYTADSSLDGGGAAPGPIAAFTNMPYVPDAGSFCGAGFVNASNQLDGVSIINGHEYAETLTDQFPAGGWIANDGEENGDLCAWLASGAGHVQNITLTTGTFAVQGTWSNTANRNLGACAVSGPIR